VGAGVALAAACSGNRFSSSDDDGGEAATAATAGGGAAGRGGGAAAGREGAGRGGTTPGAGGTGGRAAAGQGGAAAGSGATGTGGDAAPEAGVGGRPGEGGDGAGGKTGPGGGRAGASGSSTTGGVGATAGSGGAPTSCSKKKCDPNATCDDSSGVALCECSFPYQGDGAACAPYASCAALLAENPLADTGDYTIEPEGSPKLTAHCDMTSDGGGWMLVTEDMLTGKTQNHVTMSFDSDDLGGVIVSVAGTVSDCNVDVSSLITISDAVPWTRIRARYVMGGAASCWSIFGDHTMGPDARLLPFDATVDSTRNETAMGGSNGDPFDGITTRCDNSLENFWHAYNGYADRSALVVLRRNDSGKPAGLATATSCTLDARWSYQQIYVR
jgi:hypothetical protein